MIYDSAVLECAAGEECDGSEKCRSMCYREEQQSAQEMD